MVNRAISIGMLTTCLVFGLIAAVPESRASHVEVSIKSDIGLFYDQLTEYGQWRRDVKYGLIWSPSGTAPHWHPYTMGHWNHNDQLGWIWSSDLSWGWATMHYGRWFYHADYGWSWVPGIQWAPAWVAWRIGNGVVGWAPLPPGAQWIPEKGLSPDSAAAIEQIPEFAWTYVNISDFTQEKLLPYIIPSARNATLQQQTKDITRYDRQQAQVVNVGPNKIDIERATTRRVTSRQLVDVTFPKGEQATQVKANQIAVFRPYLVLDNEVPEPSTSPAATEFTRKQLEHLHKTQLQVLQNHQAAERSELARQHQQLKARPQPGRPESLVQRWIEQENQALERHNAEEARLLRHRQQQELQLLTK